MANLDDRLEQAEADRDREPDKDQVGVLEGQQREEDKSEVEVEDDAVDVAVAHYAEVTTQVASTLRGNQPALGDDLGLSAHEKAALRLLTEAVRGVDLIDEQPLLAEDRLALLNHALALLQPTLALGLVPELAELRDRYDDLVGDVTELRDRLEQLDGAQEEQAPAAQAEVQAEGADDDAQPEDKPEEKPEKDKLGIGVLGTAIRKVGKKPAKPAGEPERGTLTGKPGEPAVPDKPVLEPTVYGKPGESAVPDRPVLEPTVYGKPGEPAVPDRPVLPSTAWDGPGSGERR